jgi:hypothetical protein
VYRNLGVGSRGRQEYAEPRVDVEDDRSGIFDYIQ